MRCFSKRTYRGPLTWEFQVFPMEAFDFDLTAPHAKWYHMILMVLDDTEGRLRWNIQN